MNLSAFSAILLFALSIPVVMQYRILPVEGTPYWLFGILFFVLVGNVFLRLYPETLGNTGKKMGFMLTSLVLLIVLVGVSWTAIADRHVIAPVWQVHDIILQQEAAIRYIVRGKNPYKETYFGTPVESFRYDELGKPAVNPALYHFVMPPWYLLFPLPFYYVANHTIGYFDGRMVLILTMIGIVGLIYTWFRNKTISEVAIILTALSPATVNYFIEGRSDIFALFWLLLSLFLLTYKKYFWSAIMMGLALISKQTIWFAFPLWILYVFSEQKTKKTLMFTGVSVVVSGIVTLPFLIWNFDAFINSVFLYLSAGGPTGYPVSGYGFSMVLYSAGIIKNLHDYFPFTLMQLSFGLPVLFFVSKWFLKKPSMSRWFISYSLFLFAIWYFSRYFNNSHIAFISSLFVFGVLKKMDEDGLQSKSKKE